MWRIFPKFHGYHTLVIFVYNKPPSTFMFYGLMACGYVRPTIGSTWSGSLRWKKNWNGDLSTFLELTSLPSPPPNNNSVLLLLPIYIVFLCIEHAPLVNSGTGTGFPLHQIRSNRTTATKLGQGWRGRRGHVQIVWQKCGKAFHTVANSVQAAAATSNRDLSPQFFCLWVFLVFESSLWGEANLLF